MSLPVADGNITWKRPRGGALVLDFLTALTRRQKNPGRYQFTPRVRGGQKYGRWIVIDIWTRRICVCVCECGLYSTVWIRDLLSGASRSCGCLSHEQRLARGDAGHRIPEYKIWQQMRDRCFNPNNPSYKDYGGRGITVCEQWSSFHTFILDVGQRHDPRLSLDRFPNNDGNYEPGNCRWATRRQQCLNTRRNIKAEINGVTKTTSEWADIYGIKRVSLRSRLMRGMPVIEAITTPIKQYKQRAK